MKTVLLDVNAGIAKVVDVEPKLEAYYKLLHCRCIDIVERRIGGRWFDVMCDDEGLLQSEPIVSAFDYLGRARLVGSLMFFHHDDEGNLLGLSDDDILHIGSNIRWLPSPVHPLGFYLALGFCER
ncbi:MAG: hypothetical protein IKN72_06005 [Clostridia bacterium]|nr:hypothetical protein [Clostridia bacterium]